MITNTSIINTILIIPTDTTKRHDLITMPITRENNTSPSRYSFLRGLKNVFNNSEIERREAIYLLRPTKKVMKFLVTSRYQNAIKYSGYNKKAIALLTISVGEMRGINQAISLKPASTRRRIFKFF